MFSELSLGCSIRGRHYYATHPVPHVQSMCSPHKIDTKFSKIFSDNLQLYKQPCRTIYCQSYHSLIYFGNVQAKLWQLSTIKSCTLSTIISGISAT